MFEVAIATLLVGLLVVGAMRAVGAVFRTRTSADRLQEATMLAHAMTAEVMQCRYEDEGASPVFGPESGENSSLDPRAAFDDVDDYNSGSWSPPRAKSPTTAFAGYSGWTQAVRVVWADPTSPLADSVTDRGLKRVTVTITDPAGKKTVQTSLRSRWGAVEQSPSVATTVRTYVGSDLRVGSGTTLYSGTSVTNHARDR